MNVPFGWKGSGVVVAAILRGMAYFHLVKWIILEFVLVVVHHQRDAKVPILAKKRSSLEPCTHTAYIAVT